MHSSTRDRRSDRSRTGGNTEDSGDGFQTCFANYYIQSGTSKD